jgi:hypothetical protein
MVVTMAVEVAMMMAGYLTKNAYEEEQDLN